MRQFRKERFEGQGYDAMQDRAAFEFYLDVATSGIPLGLSRTYGLWVDEQLVSAAFGTAHRGRFMLLLTSADFDNYRKFSLGLLTIEDVIRDCIERDDTEFDLTIGDESYKTLFGTQATPISSIWCAGTPLGSVAGMALQRLPWAKGLAKNAFRNART